MNPPKYCIVEQNDSHRAAIETMLDEVFGLDRHTKTSYRLREGACAADGLSFVAQTDCGHVIAAVSFWPLCIGKTGQAALLLGPLAVRPDFHGAGIGRHLMRNGLEQARLLGHALVILVGDEPYYGRVGFKKVPAGKLTMPGPVDPQRLLYLELIAGSLSAATGLVLPAHRFSGPRDTTSGSPARAAGQATEVYRTAEFGSPI